MTTLERASVRLLFIALCFAVPSGNSAVEPSCLGKFSAEVALFDTECRLQSPTERL